VTKLLLTGHRSCGVEASVVDFDAVPDLQLTFQGESVTPLVSKDVKDTPFEHGESWLSWRNNVSVLSPLLSVTTWTGVSVVVI